MQQFLTRPFADDRVLRELIWLCLRGIVPGVIHGSPPGLRRLGQDHLLTCTDDALMRCLQKLPQWTASGSGLLAAWAFRVAGNVARNHFRDIGAGPDSVGVRLLDAAAQGGLWLDDAPDREAMRNELEARAPELARIVLARSRAVSRDVADVLQAVSARATGNPGLLRVSSYRRRKALATLRGELSRMQLSFAGLRAVATELIALSLHPELEQGGQRGRERARSKPSRKL